MTSTREHILLSLPCNAIKLPSPQQRETIIFVLDYILRESLYKDTFYLVFSYFKRFLGFHILKQVKDPLIVDLNEATVDGKMLRLFGFRLLKDLSYCSWDDALLMFVNYEALIIHKAFASKTCILLVEYHTFFPRRSKHSVSFT